MRYQDFPSKVFCLTLPKILAREPQCVVLQTSAGEIDYGLRRGVSRSSVERFFVSVCPNFARENFCAVFQKISGSEKLYGQERGLSSFSVGSLLYQHPENFGKRTLLCCVSENLW